MNAHTSASPALLIERARRSDLASISWLLDLESLPYADLKPEALDLFLVCRDEMGVAGVVGLEPHGEVALLRSLVVTNQQAGRGIGRRLVIAAEALAKENGFVAIYLLTTGAAAFFEYMGFRCIERDHAPPTIQRSRQFASLCPQTAVLMVKP